MIFTAIFLGIRRWEYLNSNSTQIFYCFFWNEGSSEEANKSDESFGYYKGIIIVVAGIEITEVCRVRGG